MREHECPLCHHRQRFVVAKPIGSVGRVGVD